MSEMEKNKVDMKQENDITKQQLEELISKYFDGQTSVADEQTLRQSLAHCRWHGGVIDEARFTMGMLSVGADRHRRAKRTTKTAPVWRIAAVAASATVVIAVAVAVLVGGGQKVMTGQGECIAYVNGKKVSGDAAVMQLVNSDLKSLDDASDAVGGNLEQQLSSLGAAIEMDN